MGSVDLRDEPVHWNLGESQSYADYLQLDLLLNAQRPLTAEHSEMLFIIVHQVSELWMRLLRHELEGVMACVARTSRARAKRLPVWRRPLVTTLMAPHRPG